MSLRRWLPPLLWAGVILFSTSLPPDVVPIQTASVDKVLHFTIYTVFAYLLSRQLAEVTRRWQAAALTVAIAMVFAGADEWHQRFIPGRSTELADWVADSFGAAAGALGFLLLRRKDRSGALITK